uniref:Uncharacterized protein n=1 Tax=Anguilla anguilla TaxID=7936 RepID=A0A0E9UN34_ANGAN
MRARGGRGDLSRRSLLSVTPKGYAATQIALRRAD